MGLGVVKGFRRQALPAAVADENPRIRPSVGQPETRVADLLFKRGKREQGKRQKRQRRQGQAGAQRPPPHVGNPEHEGRVTRAQAAQVLGVDPRLLALVLGHDAVEAAHHHAEHQGRHGHDGKRQQHHQRLGQLKGRMHLRQNQPNRQQQQPKARELPANIGRGKQEPLAEKGRRHQQHHKEDDPFEDIVERRQDLRVSPRLQAECLAAPRHVLIPPSLLGRCFRLGDGPGRLLVEPRQPLVFNAVLFEHPQPRRIQGPHVPRRL